VLEYLEQPTGITRDNYGITETPIGVNSIPKYPDGITETLFSLDELL
jgi:hypothetical protein